MSFFLYPGNQLETLAGIYCRRIHQDIGSDPMEQETVIVQTQGMAAYLRQFIARSSGIAANISMPFPEGFINRVLKANVEGFDSALEHFSQEQLAWEIFTIFQQVPEEFPELSGYLQGKGGDLRCWQLARSCAALFDRYQIYRYTDKYFPLTGDHWQSRLWKKLLGIYGKSKMQCFREFLCKDTPLAGLPRRLTVFGVGSLPPLYLDVFFKIASAVDLHFFYLTPCREYWEELYSVREQRWLNSGEVMPEAGNPLLASWGESGRELFANLLNHQDSMPYVSTEDLLFDDFIAPGGSGNVLQHVQQDILTMNDARGEKIKLTPDDSLEILNCYSPRREIEILHDKLISLINNGDVEPRDVIVMAPDINNYLPYIEAVFAQGPLHSCYTVSDRNLHGGCGIGDVFCSLLKLPECRMDVDSVLSILNHQAVFTALGIRGEELARIKSYLEGAGIRWGFDAEDHRKYCGVAFEEYSWYHGIDRIFEHFAMDCDELEKIPGTPEIPGEGELELFGKLCRFIRSLVRLRRELNMKRDLRQWMELFHRILNDFFQDYDSDSAGEIAVLRRAFTENWLIGKNLQLKEKFSLDIAADVAGAFLNSSRAHFNFLRGKITFCSMTPLRSIPAQVIAVLGMDEGAFPRRDKELSFDLTSSRLLPGDRSGAKEDRYLFLEALMSARSKFWCFYNGRSRRNGKTLVPSTVLGELMDYLEQSYGISEVKHFLQGFDPRYFIKNGVFSSNSKSDFRTACLLAGARRIESAGRKFSDPLIPVIPDAGFSLKEFIEWAKHPLSYIFKHCLNADFAVPDAARSVEAIDSVSGLQSYKLGSSISEFEKLEVDKDIAFDILRRCNVLPPGEAGVRVFNTELGKFRNLPAAWRSSFYAQQPVALNFMLNIPFLGEARPVTGVLNCSENFSEQRMIAFSKLKHSHYVNAMMCHHALCMISDAPEITTSLYTIEKDKLQLTEWCGSPRNENTLLFWERFVAAWENGFRRLPALFPKTLFEKSKSHRNPWEQVCADTFEKEYLSDKFISQSFTADAMDDPEILSEFDSFFDLFYGKSTGGGK